MRTVQDIEEAFRALADTAPEPGRLVDHATRPAATTPRRRLAPVAVAVVTAVVVGGTVYATSDRSGDAGRRPVGSGGPELPVLAAPAVDGTPDLTFRFTATAPEDGLVTSYDVNRAGQVLDFISPSAQRACAATELAYGCGTLGELTLYYVHPPKSEDGPDRTRALATHRVPVRVNGHDGFFGRIPRLDRTAEALFWEYAPGAWAEVTAPSRAAELALAESARAASRPIAVPIAPARLLDDEYVNTLSAHPSAGTGAYEVAGRGARAHRGYFLGWGDTSRELVALGGGAAEDVTANGRTWTITGSRQLVARLEGSAVPIAVQPYIGTTRDELRDILNGLRIAPDLADPASWPAAAIVFG